MTAGIKLFSRKPKIEVFRSFSFCLSFSLSLSLFLFLIFGNISGRRKRAWGLTVSIYLVKDKKLVDSIDWQIAHHNQEFFQKTYKKKEIKGKWRGIKMDSPLSQRYFDMYNISVKLRRAISFLISLFFTVMYLVNFPFNTVRLYLC